jgi:hypothetical protein
MHAMKSPPNSLGPLPVSDPLPVSLALTANAVRHGLSAELELSNSVFVSQDDDATKFTRTSPLFHTIKSVNQNFLGVRQSSKRRSDAPVRKLKEIEIGAVTSVNESK